ncbi:MAG: c-type cytochrome [Deltaproteobacteria bacterium]|nr:MAG: c-type cytochrome [Deltaproteobacteria bacterium]
MARVFLVVAALSVGAAAAAQDLERGEQLYILCKQCHGPAGAGNPEALAPAIAGLPAWYSNAQLQTFRSGGRGLHPDDVGGLRMYPMARWLESDADVAAVAAYVASLPPARPEPVLEGGDPARGAQMYQGVCIACHGPDGRGNEAIGSPSLLDSSDWYLLSSLKKFKAGIRAGNPQNPNSTLMRGMAAQLADEQAMKDVIAYVLTLRDGN